MKALNNILNQCSKRGLAFFSGAVLCFVLLGAAQTVSAQSADELYKSANQLYKDNNFEQAGAAYEKIIAQGYKTPEVYYNLGNCYFKQNNLSKCIINYERALKLAPQDEDIQHNVKLANARVVDKIIPVPQLGIITWWNNLLDSRSSTGWGYFAIYLLWGALVLFAIYLFTSLKKLAGILGSLLVVLSVCFLSFAYHQSEKEQNPGAAILTIANTFAKSAPDDGANNIFMLHEGVKFQVLDRVGEWHKIRLADGKVGWLQTGSFEKI